MGMREIACRDVTTSLITHAILVLNVDSNGHPPPVTML
jgi:hypothetical protein